MILSPRYEGEPLVSTDGPPDDQLVPVVRQRRRMETMLAELTDEQWRTGSRCDGWTVQDVIAHVIGVNAFWQASVAAGLAGSPTRVLAGFDPASTPPLMVGPMRTLTPAQIFDQFVASNDGFLGAIERLDAGGWATLAESPPGHVSIRLLAQHALWDAWIHERDIALPLGLTPPAETDEVLSTLRYAAALSPAFLITTGRPPRGLFAVEVTDPDSCFTVEVGESVVVRGDPAPAGSPCLRGNAVSLVEALSIRAPLPASTPPDWQRLLEGLEHAFTAEPSVS
jgi:uncharacterized protein (TIGR03083 family)